MENAKKTGESVRKKFGLDFMPSSGAMAPAEESSAAGVVKSFAEAVRTDLAAQFGEALMLQSGKVLQVLIAVDRSPAKRDRVHVLVDQTGLDFDEVIKIIEQLSLVGLIRYVEKDKRGNHTIELTENGSGVTALLGQAMGLLKALSNAPNHAETLYQIVDATGLDFDAAIRLTEQLGSLGLISYIEKSSRGNHLIQLTENGLSLLR